MNKTMKICAALWDFITDNNIATDAEISLVTNINGYSEDTLFDIIYARTGLRSIEQCYDEGYFITNEIRDYYNIEEA